MYFLLGPRKKTPGKNPAENVPPNPVKNILPSTLSRENAIFATSITLQKSQMIRINSCLREMFSRVLFLGGSFSDLILDFLFFYDVICL